MPRFVLCLIIAVLAPFCDCAAQSPTPEHGPRTGAAADIYGEVLAVHAQDRGSVLEPYTSATKAAVWTHHLFTTIERHPEFTADQRSVIHDALMLLTPQLFEIEQSDPRWATLVDAPLREITIRAQRLFTAALAREIFLDLGPREGSRRVQPMSCRYPENPMAKDDSPTDQRSPRATNNNMSYCQCSTTSDYCDSSGIGLYYCKGGGCTWKSSGCGTFWQYGCTGLCERREGA